MDERVRGASADSIDRYANSNGNIDEMKVVGALFIPEFVARGVVSCHITPWTESPNDRSIEDGSTRCATKQNHRFDQNRHCARAAAAAMLRQVS
jgi:hypothetical protein